MTRPTIVRCASRQERVAGLIPTHCVYRLPRESEVGICLGRERRPRAIWEASYRAGELVERLVVFLASIKLNFENRPTDALPGEARAQIWCSGSGAGRFGS